MNREYLKDKKKIVIKVGSSTLMHEDGGGLDYIKLEKLVRFICDLRNQDKDVILVSSGAISVGVKALNLARKPKTMSLKQACAAVGQGQLMMVYQKLFLEYHHMAAQVLLTFDVISSDERRRNAINTFNELLQLGAVPIVNENDTVAIDELDERFIAFGDNDTLSAIVASMVQADLLILLSDIEGLYSDDPHRNPEAKLIAEVDRIDDRILSMGKAASGKLGTGGMATKLAAARIATNSGTDMVIASGADMANIVHIMNGENIGTLFTAYRDETFDVDKFILNKEYLQ